MLSFWYCYHSDWFTSGVSNSDIFHGFTGHIKILYNKFLIYANAHDIKGLFLLCLWPAKHEFKTPEVFFATIVTLDGRGQICDVIYGRTLDKISISEKGLCFGNQRRRVFPMIFSDSNFFRKIFKNFQKSFSIFDHRPSFDFVLGF